MTQAELPFTLLSNPRAMETRLFHFDNPLRATAAYLRAQQLVEEDPGLRSTELMRDKKRGGSLLIIAAGDKTDWVSSSQGKPGVERQRYVISELANPVLPLLIRLG